MTPCDLQPQGVRVAHARNKFGRLAILSMVLCFATLLAFALVHDLKVCTRSLGSVLTAAHCHCLQLQVLLRRCWNC